MPSTNAILGRIGAAKIFAGNISNSLNLQGSANAIDIANLEKELAKTEDKEIKKRLQKKIKRLKRGNKAVTALGKAAKGATDFLLKVAEYCDIGKKVLIQWLAKTLVYVLPVLEVSVKMLLLTNIKKMISCTLDPRIPDEWRTKGVLFNELEIDPRRTLSSSPYSAWGRQNYTGIFEDENDLTGVPLFSLSWADDMNAFIWFAKNSAKFVNPICINETVEGERKLKDVFGSKSLSDDATLYNTTVIHNAESKFLPGCIFKQTPNASTIFLILWSENTPDGTSYGIRPITHSWTSVNWANNSFKPSLAKPLFNLEYINDYNENATLPKNNFNFTILPKPFTIGGGFVTDVGNSVSTLIDAAEAPLVQYVTGADISSIPLKNIKWPAVGNLLPHTARFNGKGEYDKRGKYSINEAKYNITQMSLQATSGNKTIMVFQLTPNNTTGEKVKYLVYDSKERKFYLSSKAPDNTNLHGQALNPNEASEVLVECYFGKTVYEFNYDYIMSFKLFDAQVISANIVNGLLNIDIPDPLKKVKTALKNAIGTVLNGVNNGDNDSSDSTVISNRDQAYIDRYVDTLVEKMISSEDEEFTDCFYNFSNQEYADLEASINQKIINGTKAAQELNSDSNVSAVYDILNAYKADSTLEEQEEIITRTITKAIDIASESNNGVSSNNNDINDDAVNNNTNNGDGSFITKAVKILTSSIVNALLSPKVLLLLVVNQKLMHNDITDGGNFKESMKKNYTYNVKDILNGLHALLGSVVKEIITTIQKELLKIIMAKIQEIMSAYMRLLAVEYAKKWHDMLKSLLNCVKFNWGKKKSQETKTMEEALNGAIDQVNYADIDMLVDEIMPKTKDC